MIQAQSLANVVQLADNPPLDFEPSSINDEDRPLILYIVRVPGSKDVFLTTIKPPTKVVRAEDVQNCLYYVHVDSADDERLLQDEELRLSIEKEDRVWNIAEANAGVPPVRRKPLPSRPAAHTGENPEPPPKCYPHYQQYTSSVNQMHDQPRALDGADRNGSTAKAQLIGPRPMMRTQRPDILYRQKQSDLDQLYQTNKEIQSTSKPGSLENLAAAMEEDINSSLQTSSLTQSSLTLVRRYGGEQSNVCRIDRSFRLQVFASVSGKDGLLRPLHQQLKGGSDAAGAHKAQKYFTTTLCSGHNPDINQPYSEPALDVSTSTAKHTGFDVRRYRKQLSEITNTYRQSHSQSKTTHSGGHSFSTPWGGTCQFSTGIGARAFKCKHSTSPNLEPTTISELRPDLPNAPPSRPVGSAFRTGGDVRRKSLFDNYKGNQVTISNHRHSVDIASLNTNDEEDLLDLSLGQEHAGGGFGGKLAKLGKLIIEPEGFQMLDLLVGANMALWWRMYDKDA